MAIQPITLSAKAEGFDGLGRNLNILERKVLPGADANAINRTATQARKNGIKRISQVEKKKTDRFKSIVVVVKRARAKVSPFAVIVVFRRQDRRGTALLSKPFWVGPRARRGAGFYRRRIPGAARTKGRPVTSSPNLPIYPDKDPVRDRRDDIVKAECRKALRDYYPGELAAQIDRLVGKLIRRRRR